MNYSELMRKNKMNKNFIERFTTNVNELIELINEYLNESNIVFNDVYYFDILEKMQHIQRLKQTSLLCNDEKYRDIYFNAELFSLQSIDDFVENVSKAFNENKIKCSDVLMLDYDLSDKDIYLNFMNFGKDGTNDTWFDKDGWLHPYNPEEN